MKKQVIKKEIVTTDDGKAVFQRWGCADNHKWVFDPLLGVWGANHDHCWETASGILIPDYFCLGTAMIYSDTFKIPKYNDHWRMSYYFERDDGLWDMHWGTYTYDIHTDSLNVSVHNFVQALECLHEVAVYGEELGCYLWGEEDTYS